MKLRQLVAAGALSACAFTGLAMQSASAASPVTAPPLRALGAPIGLQIGTAAIPYDLDNPAYAQITGQQFSVVTPGNEMKWETVEPTRGTYNWAPGDRLVAFAEQHDQLVRGHTLLWHSQIPAWLTQGVNNGTISTTELRDLVHKHVTDEVTHFKGKIWQWDVANEFMANSWDPHALADGVNADDFWVKNLGEGIIADAFRWAHAADPKALLFYNDYNITGEDGNNVKFNEALTFVKKLLAEGVPINGVGEQGHLDTQYGFNATKFQQDLQSFADLGLKVAVTEADVRTFVDSPTTQVPTNPTAIAKQAQYWDGLIKGCLAIKQCISFTAWGFGDVDSWVPYTFGGEGAAGLYDVNLNPKASYTTLHDDLRAAKGIAPKR
jgi:endo-1,4-beta-xylanase